MKKLIRRGTSADTTAAPGMSFSRFFKDNEPARGWAIFVMLYIVAVQWISVRPDIQALLPLVTSLQSYSRGTGFEPYKFIYKFIIPFLIALPSFDRHYFSLRNYQKRDWLIFGVVLVLASASVLAVGFSPELRSYYPSQSALTPEAKLTFVKYKLAWLVSWFLGWEFLHRYLLTRAVVRAWPKWGWTLVPLVEFVYHLSKVWLEALGMGVISIIFTRWVIARQSVVFPVLIHLAIELALIAYLVW